MADIAKSGVPSVSTRTPCAAHQVGSGLLAGEDIAAGDACYIKNDGKVYRSTGAAVNAAAKVDGYATKLAKSGEAVTLFDGADFQYGSGLTPGARYYLSGATAGALADAASTGGTGIIAYAIDTTRVRLMASRY